MEMFFSTLCLVFFVRSTRAQSLRGFTFNTGNNSFTYYDPDDSEAVVTGYIHKPTKAAAHGQAIFICHGASQKKTDVNAIARA